MSHFSKNVTGSTRLGTRCTIPVTTNAYFENSAFIKGDSLIVMAIDTIASDYDLHLVLPYKVKSGTHILSTSNTSLCKQTPIEIEEPLSELTVSMPGRSLNTYVFMIAHDDEDAIVDIAEDSDNGKTVKAKSTKSTFFDIYGRRTRRPSGLLIEQLPDGKFRKVFRKS